MLEFKELFDLQYTQGGQLQFTLYNVNTDIHEGRPVGEIYAALGLNRSEARKLLTEKLKDIEDLLTSPAQQSNITTSAYIDAHLGETTTAPAPPLCILQALAKIKNVPLYFWHHDDDGFLVQDEENVRYVENTSPTGLHLLWVNHNFKLLEKVKEHDKADWATLQAIRAEKTRLTELINNRLFVISNDERHKDREQTLDQWGKIAFNLFNAASMSQQDFALFKLLLIPEWRPSDDLQLSQDKHAYTESRIRLLTIRFFLEETQYRRVFLQIKAGQHPTEEESFRRDGKTAYQQRLETYVRLESNRIEDSLPSHQHESLVRQVRDAIIKISMAEKWNESFEALDKLEGQALTNEIKKMQAQETEFNQRYSTQETLLIELGEKIDNLNYSEQLDFLAIRNVRKLMAKKNDLPAGYQNMPRLEAEKLALVYLPLDLQNEAKETFLHKSVQNQDKMVIQYLLSRGANSGIPNKWGQTALTLTMAEGMKDIQLLSGDNKTSQFEQWLLTQNSQALFAHGARELIVRLETHFQKYAETLRKKETPGNVDYLLTAMTPGGRRRVIERRNDLMFLETQLKLAGQNNLAHHFLQLARDRSRHADKGLLNPNCALFDEIFVIMQDVMQKFSPYDPDMEPLYLSIVQRTTERNKDLEGTMVIQRQALEVVQRENQDLRKQHETHLLVIQQSREEISSLKQELQAVKKDQNDLNNKLEEREKTVEMLILEMKKDKEDRNALMQQQTEKQAALYSSFQTVLDNLTQGAFSNHSSGSSIVSNSSIVNNTGSSNALDNIRSSIITSWQNTINQSGKSEKQTNHDLGKNSNSSSTANSSSSSSSSSNNAAFEPF